MGPIEGTVTAVSAMNSPTPMTDEEFLKLRGQLRI